MSQQVYYSDRFIPIRKRDLASYYDVREVLDNVEEYEERQLERASLASPSKRRRAKQGSVVGITNPFPSHSLTSLVFQHPGQTYHVTLSSPTTIATTNSTTPSTNASSRSTGPQTPSQDTHRTSQGTQSRNREGASSHLIPLEGHNELLKAAMRCELFDETLLPSVGDEGQSSSTGQRGLTRTNLFTYATSPRNPRGNVIDTPLRDMYSTNPLKIETNYFLQKPKMIERQIPKLPFKVLDAPDLQDDFYLNLLDWSMTNCIAVGLGSCTYTWSASTAKVSKLCDLGSSDMITSVSWMQRGSHLAIGTHTGQVLLYDVHVNKKIRTFTGHEGRVGVLTWNGSTLSSGGRDRTILQRDVRSPEPFLSQLQAHRQEVCGLKWSPDGGAMLASGGNDNRLILWDPRSHQEPIMKFRDHIAAVKAIAWSPHQHGLLASGGGTADRKIRFWNTLSLQQVSYLDTGSQVCNLAWSSTANEFVSTHGYSLNQVIVWKYPSMQQLGLLMGHSMRVLYLAVSPDNQSIVTGAGDETLRFWNVFSKPHNSNAYQSILSPFRQLR